jgi:hypothetical protein
MNQISGAAYRDFGQFIHTYAVLEAIIVQGAGPAVG